jgi:hypothetical protein
MISRIESVIAVFENDASLALQPYRILPALS